MEDFFEIMVENTAEFERDQSSVRLAFNAIASVNAFIAHVFYNLKETTSPLVDHLQEDGDDKFRYMLAEKSESIKIIVDVANAYKHAKLTRKQPLIKNSEAVKNTKSGYGAGLYGRDLYGSSERISTVFISLDDGRDFPVKEILIKAIEELSDILEK